jgi:hypothetical protein
VDRGDGRRDFGPGRRLSNGGGELFQIVGHQRVILGGHHPPSHWSRCWATKSSSLRWG